ncbi:MAG TPA: biopolymer transporter ExbD [Longimicrobiales bacterium]|nr:biopolymer transporter ExbD [Longimicrobiales bacterium]
MTPMIDVLLVLLIIFLVIQPAVLEGILVSVPAVQTAEATEALEPLVLEVGPGPAYRLGGVEVAAGELGPRVRAALEERGADTTLFLRADETLPYGSVIAAADEARAAGAARVALVPRSAGAAGGSRPGTAGVRTPVAGAEAGQ